MITHCRGENGRKRGSPPGKGRRCGNHHHTSFCHHHTWQKDDPTPWSEESVPLCPSLYKSNTEYHRVGDPCQQPGRYPGGYCQYHSASKSEKEPEKAKDVCIAIKRNGEPCGGSCTGSWCYIHVAKAVAAMPGPRAITRGMRGAVFKASGGECYVCATVIRSDAFHCAHVVPDVGGGAATLENLRATCSTCNLECGRQNLDEFKVDKSWQIVNLPKRETVSLNNIMSADVDIAQMKEELRKLMEVATSLVDKINALESGN
jgi:5-methylcytosine-specific restriction endonuclease McrA